MKLNIGDYEVDVKARNNFLNEKANKEDTMNFLVTIALLAYEACDKYGMDGYGSLSDWAEQYRKDIYGFLESKGHFKKYEGAEE